MGLWKALFGGGNKPTAKKRAAQDFDPESLVQELRAEGRGAKADDVTVESSPRDVFRYTFVRLMAGAPPAALREDFKKRGFSLKVADSYITLVQATMFPGGEAR